MGYAEKFWIVLDIVPESDSAGRSITKSRPSRSGPRAVNGRVIGEKIHGVSNPVEVETAASYLDFAKGKRAYLACVAVRQRPTCPTSR